MLLRQKGIYKSLGTDSRAAAVQLVRVLSVEWTPFLHGRVSSTQPKYKKRAKRHPVIGLWVSRLVALLAEDGRKPKRERRSGCRLFEQLQDEGYAGSHVTLQPYVRDWKRE